MSGGWLISEDLAGSLPQFGHIDLGFFGIHSSLLFRGSCDKESESGDSSSREIYIIGEIGLQIGVWVECSRFGHSMEWKGRRLPPAAYIIGNGRNQAAVKPGISKLQFASVPAY